MAKNSRHSFLHKNKITNRKFIQRKFNAFVNFLFEEVHGQSLSIFRILFGFLMFLDIPQERGLEDADLRFGDENYCFFPLFQWIEPIPLQWAGILYSTMWIGTIGIMVGFKFRFSCVLFLVPYTYFFLLDKSRWNNHSYLFGLFAFLLSFTGAADSMSVGGKPENQGRVARWNYFILKFQIFLLYFYAGVKKMDSDWINGYSMKNLSKHFLFDPLRLALSDEQIDYYMIHMGGLFYDLTVGFMLNFEITKKVAFTLSFLFHGLNSQIFDIGMFPYVCMASLVLYRDSNIYPANIPRNERKIKPPKARKPKVGVHQQATPKVLKPDRKNLKTGMLCLYMAVQLLLPFSHSITQGYNNWTNGLYGYSWDMMVNSWQTLHQKITVKNTITGEERFLDPNVWVGNDRWSSHADQAIQYAKCIQRNLGRFNITDIEIYLDVWKSLNGRFQQRIYNPNVNLLKTDWSPFTPPTILLPLLERFTDYRKSFEILIKDIPTNSNAIFVADFPGLYLENYMPEELTNITIILLNGSITVEDSKNHTLKTVADKLPITSGAFHRVHTGKQHSCYMYVYYNISNTDEDIPYNANHTTALSGLQKFFVKKLDVFKQGAYIVAYSYLNLLFDIPIEVRQAS